MKNKTKNRKYATTDEAEKIKALLARHKFRFSKSMGQNFLINPEIPERIADSARLARDTHVLEIGPGIGALTAELCRRAGFVTAVELDTALLPILEETLQKCENYEIVRGDAMKLGIRELMTRRGETRLAACSNLPYNITAPAIAAMLEAGVFESITIMVQREAARRVCALPGTPDYGAFTVFINYHADAEALFDVPPESFMPAPKVTSSVVRLTPHAPPPEIEDADFFFRVVRAAFAQRRKTLVNALVSGGFGLPKDAAADMLTAEGIDVLARGETLGIPEFAALARRIADF
ncbi:MAG: 16S rRNA (adenine(1518)-N(6)/adenine(1519)-N(6))-dimethyltransferase RsmA [Oscillospiraceae bacterium]|jgi:16S rRNA (adenine1518-N6/adenine1519-N6)-dimethyltransferase|nr:16S rRNA (adenine(1518)-N(6)/adenine(1519)-N(6))-dimethyltransferase RsmA [Oscillospiraceae bacterium]